LATSRATQKSGAEGLAIGYARFSTDDQSSTPQIDALKQAGCSRVFTDKVGGARADRPGLEAALAHLRAGDTLVVWKLDRLGRNIKGLVDLVNSLQERGVHFRSLTDRIDTDSPAGPFFFHIMGSLAQMERDLLVERTRVGLTVARKLGRIGGRKRRMTDTKIKAARRLLTGGTPPRDVAQNLGISVPTLYRWLPASART
jgi:DNA invertase Pin-like site-specific DNA recombinase